MLRLIVPAKDSQVTMNYLLLKEQNLEGWKARHAEELDSWKDVDRKAQIMSTVSVAFVAIIFNGVLNYGAKLNTSQSVVLACVLVCLAGALIFGLFAVKLRMTWESPNGRLLDHIITSKINSASILDDLHNNLLLNDIIACWKESVVHLQNELKEKQKMLQCLFICLFASSVLIILGLSLFLFQSNNSSEPVFKLLTESL